MAAHIILVWYDTNNIEADILSKYPTYKFHFYDDKQTCVDFISSVSSSETLFLIASVSCAHEVLSTIHGLNQLDSVLIYSKEEDHEMEKSLTHHYPKVIGIFSQFDCLFTSIEEHIDLARKYIESFTFYEQRQRSTRDLSRESGSFLWLRIFKDLVAKLPHDEQAKQEMIDKLKECYHNNNRQLKLIENFSQDYRSENAIRWYTGEPFLYQQLNRALRTEDIDLLYKFRYFISDLSRSLLGEHEILKDSFDSMTFYRGVKLAKEEATTLEDNVGKIISTNGYLSTSFDRAVVVPFADMSTDTETSVIFEIECDFRTTNSVIMASVAHLSQHSQEREVLFDLDATFEIVSATRNLSDNTLEIKIKATDEGASLAQEHIREHDRLLKTSSTVLLYGYLLTVTGHYEKSRQYFHRLEENPNGEDIAFIHNYLGQAYRSRGDNDTALKYYQDSLALLRNAESSRDLVACYLLINIGAILTTKGQYDNALDYYVRAFNTSKTSSNYCIMTSSMEGIGVIHKRRGDYPEALKYFQSSLEIREKYLPTEHRDMGRVLSYIALAYDEMDQLDTALEYHQRSLKTNERCLPVGHYHISCNLHLIGHNSANRGKHDEALQYYTNSLKMRAETFPNGHLSIAQALSSIGCIHYLKKDYTHALNYLEKSLCMRDSLFVGIKDRTLINIFKYLGLVCTKLNKCDDALTHHMCALEVAEDIYPIGHSTITNCLTNIGNAYREMQRVSKAFEYYEKATKNDEQNSFQPNLIQLAHIHENRGICLCQQGDERTGLEHRLKCVRLLSEVYPRIQYANVANYVGDQFFTKGIYDHALECYFISLDIKLECLPLDDIGIAETVLDIGDLYYELEKDQQRESNDQFESRASAYYTKAVHMYKAKNDVNLIHICNRIGSLYEKIHKYHLALEYYTQATETKEEAT